VFEIKHSKCSLSQHAVTNNMQFHNLKMEQDRQCTYKATLRLVCATIIAAEKQ